MNNVIPLIFKFEEQNIRTWVDEFSHRWYCIIDVFKALGYSNPMVSSSRLELEESGICKLHMETNRGSREVRFINEPNLYEVILHSRLPAAKRFKKWLKETVIPSLRSTGKYEMPLNIESDNAVSFINKVAEVDLKLETISHTDNKAALPELLGVLKEIKETLVFLRNSAANESYGAHKLDDTSKVVPFPAKECEPNVMQPGWRYTPTKLGQMFGGRSATAINEVLQKLGLLNRIHGKCVLTTLGKAYGDYYEAQNPIQGSYVAISWFEPVIGLIQNYFSQKQGKYNPFS